MARHERETPLVDEEKEKAAIEWENKVLFILMPSVGLVAFILGLVGFILSLGSDKSNKVPVAIFLLILALLGIGGMAYGVVQFLKKRKAGAPKEEKESSEE